MPDSTSKSDTTTGAGTTTGTGMDTVGGQTTAGQITGGNLDNSVTTGNSSKGTPAAGAIASAPASSQSGHLDAGRTDALSATGGRATPDFGPLANGTLSGGDTLDDGGGQPRGRLWAIRMPRRGTPPVARPTGAESRRRKIRPS